MPKVINVVIIQQIFPPFRDAFFTKLDRVKEINLSVICGKPHKSKARESFENHDVIKVKFIRNLFCGPTGNFTYQHGALSRILEENPGVIIIEFDLRIATLWVLFFLRLFMPFKLVLWGHGFGPRSSKTIKWIRVFLAKKSDAMILYGENAALEFYNAGVQKNKINVAYNSIDTAEINNLVSKKNVTKRCTLTFIGRLIKGKKVDLLLRALSLIRKDDLSKIEVAIIGDGPEKNNLIQHANDLGISNEVKFYGSITSEKILSEFFNRSFACVSPGYVGLSAIHSLAYRVPLIVANREEHSPEIEALKHKINSIFFESDNAQMLANAVMELFSNREYAEALGEGQSEAFLKRFSTEAMVNKFVSVVRNLDTTQNEI